MRRKAIDGLSMHDRIASGFSAPTRGEREANLRKVRALFFGYTLGWVCITAGIGWTAWLPMGAKLVMCGVAIIVYITTIGSVIDG